MGERSFFMRVCINRECGFAFKKGATVGKMLLWLFSDMNLI